MLRWAQPVPGLAVVTAPTPSQPTVKPMPSTKSKARISAVSHRRPLKKPHHKIRDATTVSKSSPAQANTPRGKVAKTKPTAAIRAPTDGPRTVRASSKLARVIALLRRKGGVTIAEISKATGWQAHSVRGAISGTIKKKLGLMVLSEKADVIRTYRIVG
jgi:hypothetical protein